MTQWVLVLVLVELLHGVKLGVRLCLVSLLHLVEEPEHLLRWHTKGSHLILLLGILHPQALEVESDRRFAYQGIPFSLLCHCQRR